MQFKIEALTPYQVSKIIQSESVDSSTRKEIIEKYPDALKQVQITMTKGDYAYLMKNRPLIRFRPLKNSFVKKGDKILLATALGVSNNQVDETIEEIIDTNFDIMRFPKEYIDKAKAYVYRHGTKDQVLSFLKNELSDVKTNLQLLYKTLDDNTGGLCEYFQRPCHMMDNKTLGDIYKIVQDSLMNSQNAGEISADDNMKTANWALKRIYQIQNDSRVIRAAKVVYNND